MVMFIGSEKRRRHRFADESIENAEKALNNPFVRDALGLHALRALQVVGQLYVPNMKNGVFEKPKNTPETSIPIIPMSNYRVLIRPDVISWMHPEQADNLNEVLINDFGEPMSEESMHSLKQYIADSISKAKRNLIKLELGSDDSLAGVNAWNCSVDIGDTDQGSKTYQVRTLPLLAQRMEKRAKSDIIMIHETAHLVQALKQVVAPSSPEELELEMCENELQAYHLEVLAGIALYGRDWMQENFPNHVELEDARHATNGPHAPYFVNEELYGKLTTDNFVVAQ